jgi:hypothetical protein
MQGSDEVVAHGHRFDLSPAVTSSSSLKADHYRMVDHGREIRAVGPATRVILLLRASVIVWL